MQNKIKEIQDYFKNKIIAWEFKYTLWKNEINILINEKYRFNFLVDIVSMQMPTWKQEENFMDLDFSQEETKIFWEIFEKIKLENQSKDEKEKDLKEFARIKKLYNLI